MKNLINKINESKIQSVIPVSWEEEINNQLKISLTDNGFIIKLINKYISKDSVLNEYKANKNIIWIVNCNEKEFSFDGSYYSVKSLGYHINFFGILFLHYKGFFYDIKSKSFNNDITHGFAFRYNNEQFLNIINNYR